MFVSDAPKAHKGLCSTARAGPFGASHPHLWAELARTRQPGRTTHVRRPHGRGLRWPHRARAHPGSRGLVERILGKPARLQKPLGLPNVAVALAACLASSSNARLRHQKLGGCPKLSIRVVKGGLGVVRMLDVHWACGAALEHAASMNVRRVAWRASAGFAAFSVGVRGVGRGRRPRHVTAPQQLPHDPRYRIGVIASSAMSWKRKSAVACVCVCVCADAAVAGRSGALRAASCGRTMRSLGRPSPVVPSWPTSGRWRRCSSTRTCRRGGRGVAGSGSRTGAWFGGGSRPRGSASTGPRPRGWPGVGGGLRTVEEERKRFLGVCGAAPGDISRMSISGVVQRRPELGGLDIGLKTGARGSEADRIEISTSGVQIRALSVDVRTNARLIKLGHPWTTPRVGIQQRATPQTHPTMASLANLLCRVWPATPTSRSWPREHGEMHGGDAL